VEAPLLIWVQAHDGPGDMCIIPGLGKDEGAVYSCRSFEDDDGLGGLGLVRWYLRIDTAENA
jgi:hypothetical protein